MAQQDTALVPVEKTVESCEDEIVAVAVEAGSQRRMNVPVRPIVEYLGLD